MLLLATELPSANTALRNSVLKEAIRKVEKNAKINDDIDGDATVNKRIVSSIKHIITSLKTFGRNDREQIRFNDSIAFAISGDNSISKLIETTGLSRNSIESGRNLRELFETELSKAEDELDVAVQVGDPAVVEDMGLGEPDSSDANSGGSCLSSQSEGSVPGVKRAKRADNGSGKKKKKVNRFRFLFCVKARKERYDAIPSEPIQDFCHGSQWGGRVDTCKLNRQPVLVRQPKGGYQYEPTRSYQYTVSEMYAQFKISEYGARLRLVNKGRDLSQRKFRELICPCMTKAKQRDAADQIVAEFKQCLKTWERMRKRDNNVKTAIQRCRNTECRLHNEGSNQAALYASASKSTTNFLKYLLCPQIERNELAIQVGDTVSYDNRLKVQMSANIKAAENNEALQKVNFLASGLCMGEYF
jgi:hypothetical protein